MPDIEHLTEAVRFLLTVEMQRTSSAENHALACGYLDNLTHPEPEPVALAKGDE